MIPNLINHWLNILISVVLDDRIVYFVSHFPKNKAGFSALLRMELPGKFQINPATLEGMYTQEIKAHSPLSTIEVKE